MKKFLSLVLALVMTMSLVTVAGAADFTDDAKVNYDEAVDVISALGIVGGYADGSFNPEGTLTRGAAAKIICNIMIGPEAAADLDTAAAPFSDVPADHTFAGPIAFCVEKNIVSGYADGTFRPAATLTGYAFAKMLLTALGYDQVTEGYTGTDNWSINVAEDMKSLKTADGDDAGSDLDSWTLLEGFEGKFYGSKYITREQACLLALNALQAYTVRYNESGNNVTIGDIVITSNKTFAGYVEMLKDKNFSLEKKASDTDELGRSAYTWYIEENGVAGLQSKDTTIGTYAAKADYVIENKLTADEWKDLLEDLDIAADKMGGLTAASTANGKTIELYFNDDGDEVASYVAYAAVLVGASKTPDKASTPDEDERTITFAGFSKVVADDEVKTGTEIENFDEAYEALEDDKDQKFLVVESNKTANKVYSVEIPEVIEGKISRVNASKGTIVVDGETYMYDSCSPSIGEAKLTVGANGVVYAVEAVDAEYSDVIYVAKVFQGDADKWGNSVWTAQIVNEEYEVAEITLATPTQNDPATEADEAVNASVTTSTTGFFVYELNDDDEYVLTAATADNADYKAFVNGVAIDDEDKYVSNSGKVYFADDMTVVFIADKATADMAVTVKTGAQNIAAGKTMAYVLNSDKDIAVLYVDAKYSAGASEDVLYINDTTSTPVANLKGKSALAYTVYMNGAEEEIMIDSGLNGVGFYTYELDEETGEYKVTKSTTDMYVEKVVGTDLTINKDGTVDFGALTDVAIAGEIYDLTDEGLVTAEILKDWATAEADGGEGYTIKVSFVYDAEEEEITALYVVSAVAPVEAPVVTPGTTPVA